MNIFMAIYMPRRKRKSSQEKAYIIQDIVPEQDHFSKTTGTRNPIIESSDFPVSGEIPGGVGVFTGFAFSPKFPTIR
jgi:hypothetical protein